MMVLYAVEDFRMDWTTLTDAMDEQDFAKFEF